MKYLEEVVSERGVCKSSSENNIHGLLLEEHNPHKGMPQRCNSIFLRFGLHQLDMTKNG